MEVPFERIRTALTRPSTVPAGMMQSQALATASDDPPNRRTTVWLRSHYAPFLEITVASTGYSVSCRRWPLRAYAFSALSQNSILRSKKCQIFAKGESFIADLNKI